LLVGAQRCDEATPVLQSALDELDKMRSNPDPQWQPQARLLLGHCELATSQRSEGMQLMSAARQTLRTMPAIEIDLCPTAQTLLGGK
jgi:hypothetical protein